MCILIHFRSWHEFGHEIRQIPIYDGGWMVGHRREKEKIIRERRVCWCGEIQERERRETIILGGRV